MGACFRTYNNKNILAPYSLPGIIQVYGNPWDPKSICERLYLHPWRTVEFLQPLQTGCALWRVSQSLQRLSLLLFKSHFKSFPLSPHLVQLLRRTLQQCFVDYETSTFSFPSAWGWVGRIFRWILPLGLSVIKVFPHNCAGYISM